MQSRRIATSHDMARNMGARQAAQAIFWYNSNLMAREAQIVAYEGDALRALPSRSSGREAVLALPLTRLLVRVVRVPAGEDPVAVATPLLKALSPFPDEELTVSCETVGENEAGSVVIAAAMPEGAADGVAEALDERKLTVTRVDVLALGHLRSAWGRLNVEDGCRRIVRLRSPDCISVFVLDGDRPVAISAVVDEGDLKRGEMLALLEAEDFAGARPLAETVDLGEAQGDEALEGIAERSDDPASLNALPASWREVMDETRFKAKLVKFLVVAGSVWALAMAVLFGVPVVYGFMADHQKGLSRQHDRKYREVVAMKERVEIVRKYSDHTLGALEIMKAVSDRLPEGVTLSSWNYKQGDGLRISGEAPLDGSELDLKDAMEALTYGNESGEQARVFPVVRLGNTSESKGMRRFSLDLSMKPEEDE